MCRVCMIYLFNSIYLNEKPCAVKVACTVLMRGNGRNVSFSILYFFPHKNIKLLFRLSSIKGNAFDCKSNNDGSILSLVSYLSKKIKAL